MHKVKKQTQLGAFLARTFEKKKSFLLACTQLGAGPQETEKDKSYDF